MKYIFTKHQKPINPDPQYGKTHYIQLGVESRSGEKRWGKKVHQDVLFWSKAISSKGKLKMYASKFYLNGGYWEFKDGIYYGVKTPYGRRILRIVKLKKI